MAYKKLVYYITGISLAGIVDSAYLTFSYSRGYIACLEAFGCEQVLSSSYATILGIPVALLGIIYYSSLLVASVIYLFSRDKNWSRLILYYLPWPGFLFSLCLVYLQIFVIKAICQYCLLSALFSTLLFVLSILLKQKNKKPDDK